MPPYLFFQRCWLLMTYVFLFAEAISFQRPWVVGRNRGNLDICWKMDRNRFKPQAICSNSHAFLLGLTHANICRMIFSHDPVVSLCTSAFSEDFLPSDWYLCEPQYLSLTLLCEPYLYQERVFASVPDYFI